MKATLTFALVMNPDTGLKEPAVRATTKVGDKTVRYLGANDESALRGLRAEVQRYEMIGELKALYPKEVEL